jgi:chromosome segregation ATPase
MYIPTVYVLFAGELLVLLLVLTLLLVLYIYRQRGGKDTAEGQQDSDQESTENSYLQHLEQELQRNTARLAQAGPDTDSDSGAAATDPASGDSKLLQARYMFLQAEKHAAAHSDDEQVFWDSIYKSMRNLLKEFETVKQEQLVVHEESVEHKKQTIEKVFYIETQGKKVNDEINKLKDIIYDQENSINGLRKSLHHAEDHFPEDSEKLEVLRNQLDSFERQIRDSTVCMEVLELENDRLQEEVHKLEDRLKTSSAAGADADKSGAPKINLQEMKEVLDKQTLQIEELHQTIESLKLDDEQSGQLRTTIDSFARTSQEMMGCITILEEENEHLKEQLHDIEDHAVEDAPAGAAESTDELHQQIKSLQEEIIKKDVNYAKLQDEFSSMEKEYLAMYEAIHGDNS